MLQESLDLNQVGLSNTQVADIFKAVEARHVTGRETTDQTGQSYAPLKYESLDPRIKNLTPKLEQYRLFRTIPKTPISNTVHEYNQQVSFGQNSANGIAEGEVPEENDSEFIRREALLKYTGEVRKISDVVLSGIKTARGSNASEIISKEKDDSIKSMHRTLENLLVHGNSKNIPLNFDGLHALHSSSKYWANMNAYQDGENVIDQRGDYLTEDTLEDSITALVDGDGEGDPSQAQFWTPHAVLTGLTKQVKNPKFYIPANANSGAVLGDHFTGYNSQLGKFPFMPDKFLRRNKARYTTYPATHPSKAPNAVVPDGGTPITVATDVDTRFANNDGDYFYAVAAKNRFGESVLVQMGGSLQSVAATEVVNLLFTDGGGAHPASSYVVYRSQKDPASTIANTPLYPIFEVSVSELAAGYDGGGAGVIRDKNRILPNTEDAWLIQWDSDVLEMGQLGGMKKIDLPQNAYLGRAFATVYYGMPLLYAPKRIVKVMNIRKG